MKLRRKAWILLGKVGNALVFSVKMIMENTDVWNLSRGMNKRHESNGSGFLWKGQILCTRTKGLVYSYALMVIWLEVAEKRHFFSVCIMSFLPFCTFLCKIDFEWEYVKKSIRGNTHIKSLNLNFQLRGIATDSVRPLRAAGHMGATVAAYVVRKGQSKSVAVPVFLLTKTDLRKNCNKRRKS